MKAPKKFKYSPNGFIVIQVAKDEEMSEAAIKLSLIHISEPTRPY